MLEAGNETTSTSLRWALLLMAKYPDIQKRVQEEIERAIGGREPVYADKPKMPFTESVMNESMRFAAIVPLAPHRVVSPVQIDGYELPVDTYVLGNLYAVQHDPRVWPDPDHFNPEANFPTNVPDDQKEKVAERLEHFIPFSIGKRVCLGETLARQEYFIFFVGLMQRFSINAHPDHPLPSEYIGTHGTTRTPLDYKLVFQRRG